MTFAEAAKKLDEIAGDKYHSIEYEESTHTDGKKEAECGLYIRDKNWFKADTWEHAFMMLEMSLPTPFTTEGRPKG